MENAQDELNAANGGVGGGSTPSLYSSMVHSDYYSETGADMSVGPGGEMDESVSGRSSVRSTAGAPERGRLDKIDWNKQVRKNKHF